MSRTPLEADLPVPRRASGAGGRAGRGQRRAGGAARRRQDHAGAAAPARPMVPGRIVMLEPRRLAARAAATRMAALLGEAVGGRSGSAPGSTPPCPRHPDRGGHRGAAGAPPAVRPGAGRRRPGDPGRGARARAGGGPGAGPVPGPAAPVAARVAAAGDVRHRRRRAAVGADGRAGDRERGADVPGGRGACQARHRLAARPARRGRARGAGRAGRHEGDVLAFLPGMGEIRRAQAALDGCGALVLPLHGDLPPAEQDRALRPADGPPGRAGDQHRGDVADRAGRARGGGWRLAAGAAAGHRDRADPACHRAHQPRRRRPAGRTRRAGGAGCRDPAVVPGAASRPGAVRPAGDRGGGAERPGAGLPRLGHGAGGAAVPGPAGRRGAGRRPRPADRSGRVGGGCADRRRAADGGAGRASAAGRHDAGRPRPGRAALAADLAALLEERDPLRERDAPADIALRLEALAGRRDADRGALARIRPGRRAVSPPAARAAPAAGDPAPLLAAAFPDRIAQRRGEAGSFRLSGGGGREAAAGRSAGPGGRCSRWGRWSWAPRPASASPRRSTRRTCRRTA